MSDYLIQRLRAQSAAASVERARRRRRRVVFSARGLGATALGAAIAASAFASYAITGTLWLPSFPSGEYLTVFTKFALNSDDPRPTSGPSAQPIDIAGPDLTPTGSIAPARPHDPTSQVFVTNPPR
jgi:hypothetical protein